MNLLEVHENIKTIFLHKDAEPFFTYQTIQESRKLDYDLVFVRNINDIPRISETFFAWISAVEEGKQI